MFTIDIEIGAFATTLAVCHLAQHTTVGAGDALDGHIRAVHVIRLLHRRIAFEVDILGCHLSVGKQLVEPLGSCDKATLTMRDGHHIAFTQLCFAHPRREVAHHLGVGYQALVATDGVEGQRGRINTLRTYLAVWHKTQFHQSLETVADSQHQAVTLFQQLHNGISYLWVAEHAGDKLGAAFRLIACRKASGNHHHLALSDGTGESIDALAYLTSILIAEHERLHFGTRTQECPRRVVLAVGTRECGDKHFGLCHLMLAHIHFLCRVERLILHWGGFNIALGGENIFQTACPCLQHLVHRNTLFAYLKHAVISHTTYLSRHCRQLTAILHLYHNGTIFLLKQFVHIKFSIEADTQPIAKRHLAHSLGNAAEAYSVGRLDGTSAHRLTQHLVHSQQHTVVRHLHLVGLDFE